MQSPCVVIVRCASKRYPPCALAGVCSEEVTCRCANCNLPSMLPFLAWVATHWDDDRYLPHSLDMYRFIWTLESSGWKKKWNGWMLTFSRWMRKRSISSSLIFFTYTYKPKSEFLTSNLELILRFFLIIVYYKNFIQKLIFVCNYIVWWPHSFFFFTDSYIASSYFPPPGRLLGCSPCASLTRPPLDRCYQ